MVCELGALCTAVRRLRSRQDFIEDQKTLGTIIYNVPRLHPWQPGPCALVAWKRVRVSQFT